MNDNAAQRHSGGSKRVTPKGTKPKARRRRSPWRTMWNHALTLSNVSPTAKAVGHLLQDRSDDTLKPVWGGQARMGDYLDRCERTVRYRLKELEDAGFIEVDRGQVVKDESGRYRRAHPNTYRFTFPEWWSPPNAAGKRAGQSMRQRVAAPSPSENSLKEDDEPSLHPNGTKRPRSAERTEWECPNHGRRKTMKCCNAEKIEVRNVRCRSCQLGQWVPASRAEGFACCNPALEEQIGEALEIETRPHWRRVLMMANGPAMQKRVLREWIDYRMQEAAA